MGKIEEFLDKSTKAKVEALKHQSICQNCGKRYTKKDGHEKYCSGYCRREVKERKARRGMRRIRQQQQRKKNKRYTTCQVCGYNEAVDLHHEGNKLYCLCPNHHALITRGIRRIEDYNITPL